MAIPVGQRLGPYEILSAIGAGGMGEVYRARDTCLNRTVSIKVLPAHLSDRPDLRERFEREARTIASLNHPHICTLYDIGHQNGIDFLVMECLEGETLAEHLKNVRCRSIRRCHRDCRCSGQGTSQGRQPPRQMKFQKMTFDPEKIDRKYRYSWELGEAGGVVLGSNREWSDKPYLGVHTNGDIMVEAMLRLRNRYGQDLAELPVSSSEEFSARAMTDRRQ